MTNKIPYETLDPETGTKCALSHTAWWMMPSPIWKRSANAPSGSRYRRRWPPGSMSRLLDEPAGADAAYQEFLENILPYPMGNIHPRFWAWYMGNGTIFGALADFMAAIMNPNLGGGNHVPIWSRSR